MDLGPIAGRKAVVGIGFALTHALEDHRRPMPFPLFRRIVVSTVSKNRGAGGVECRRRQMTGVSRSSVPSSPTTSTRRNRSAPRRPSSVTSWAFSSATVRNDMAALEAGGLHRAAAHQLGPHPHRQGLSAVRRPHQRDQAALDGRTSRDPLGARQRRRPRRRAAPVGEAARAQSHPAGRRHPVPGPARRRACGTWKWSP